MPKLLLKPIVRLVLILCAGAGGLVLKTIYSWPTLEVNSFDHSATIVTLATISGISLLILFLDMANFGYTSIKLKQYPPLGMKYVPSLGKTSAQAGLNAVLQGWVVLILGLVLSIAVSVVLISLWMSFSW